MATKSMEMGDCLELGDHVCNKIIDTVLHLMNTTHPAVNGLPFSTNLALELFKRDGMLSDMYPEISIEMENLISLEYDKLDELEQHCVFLYCDLSENDKSQIVGSILWWLQERLEDMGSSMLSLNSGDNKFLS